MKKRIEFRKPTFLAITVLTVFALAALPLLAQGISPVITETGKISLSVDGLGTNLASGVIDVLKPAGATVRRAAFACASNSRRVILDGQVSIDGTPINWSLTRFTDAGPANPNFFHSTFADVTAVVSGKLAAAAAGLVPFTVAEVGTGSIDGCILAVIFDDLAQTVDRTAILLFGGQTTTGDTFSITVTPPIDLLDVNLVLDFGLGIGFGFQGGTFPPNFCGPGGQISLVDVNLTRLTSCAGHFDDGVGANGALLTVGGLGDGNANPPNPFRPGQIGTVEDELYSLIPFVNQGDTLITVNTINPSNDDVIFFAHLLTLGTGVVGPPQEEEITKDLVEGPPEIGIYLPEPTQYVFEIAYTGPAALVVDTVPAEFEIVELIPSSDAPDAIYFDPSQGRGNSANRIEWLVPEGSHTLTVVIRTIVNPGRRRNQAPVFKPTSCGPLPINDGAIAFEVEEFGDLVLVEVQAVTDSQTLATLVDDSGEPGRVDGVDALALELMSEPVLQRVVIVGPSNPLIVEAIAGAKPCEEG